MRRVVPALTAVSALAALILVLVLLRSGGADGDRGAGRLVGDGLGTVYQRARGGEQISDANVKLFNTGGRTVTITGVTFMSVAGVRAADVSITAAGGGRIIDSDGGLVFGGPGRLYPERAIRPIAGFALPPASTPQGRDGAMLIFTLRVPAAPSGVKLDGVRISYRAGGKQRTLDVVHALLVCAARAARCDPLASSGPVDDV